MNLTKSTFFTIAILLLFIFKVKSQNIVIIESQSYSVQHMDEKWKGAFLARELPANIKSQNTLDSISNLADIDILIISNGLINIPSYRLQTIELFIKQGGHVYLQSEYEIQASGNQAFSQLVNNLGGTFNWEGEISGNLAPVQIANFFMENEDSIPFFWYGTYGSGDEYIVPFLERDNKNFGFYFCPSNPAYGKIITTTDQDWIRLDMKPELLDRIVFFLQEQISFQQPSLTTYSSNENPCANDDVIYSVAIDSLNATNIIEFQWYINDLEISDANDSIFVTNLNNNDSIFCKVVFQKDCAQFNLNSPTYHQSIIDDFTPSIFEIYYDSTQVYCEGTSVLFEANFPIQTASSNITYQWFVNQVLIQGATDSTFTFDYLNESVVSCNLIYDNICDSGIIINSNNILIDLEEIISDPIFYIEATNETSCEGEPISYVVHSPELDDVNNYIWKIDGEIQSQGSPSFIHNNPTNGQVLTCEASSNYPCLSSSLLTTTPLILDLDPILIPSFSLHTNSTKICEGQSAPFEIIHNNIFTNFSLLYQWQINGENVGTNSPFFEFIPTSNFQTVRCIISIDNICSSINEFTTNEIQIEVIEITSPNLKLITNQSFSCKGELVIAEAIGTNLPDNNIYEWFLDDQFVYSSTTPFFYCDTITNLQNLHCEISIPAHLCVDQQEIISDIIPFTVSNIAVDIIELHPEMCGEDGHVEIEPSEGIAPYLYHWDDSSTSIRREELSTGNYQLTVTDALGCEMIETITIDKYGDSITSDIKLVDYDPDLNYGYLKVTTNAVNPYFYWKQSIGLSCSSCPQPFFEGGLVSTYEVIITDSRGCSITHSFEMPIPNKTISNDIYIPNAFTPNGDEVNDYFTAYGYNDAYEIKNIKIYTRNGNLVFENNNLALSDEENGWDGKNFKNNKVQDGVYLYFITIQMGDKLKTFNGDITVH